MPSLPWLAVQYPYPYPPADPHRQNPKHRQVSEEARRRYERYGRKLEFVQDDEITAERGGGPAWVAAPLEGGFVCIVVCVLFFWFEWASAPALPIHV